MVVFGVERTMAKCHEPAYERCLRRTPLGSLRGARKRQGVAPPGMAAS
jgi:hypothetical protein